jgi:acyl-CoA synthetase (AMP-forming)/AMP-acid ligase II
VDDCAWLIFTSGTTGTPKGVMLTHASLAAGVANSAIARPLAEDDVYLFPFPLFHVAAYNVLHAHLRRRPVVLVPRFDAEEVLALIESEGVTCCSLAPTMVAMLLDHPARRADSLQGLRQISYGASAMPLDLLRRVLQELPHCGLAQGYGMTELSGNAVFLTPDDHRRAAADEPELLAAAGRPGPLVALRIVDDDDRPVATGQPGEILVRGDQVCAGYWNDAAATEASRIGPWLRTGDIGRIVDGVLFVVDRKKDLIITGGENVASREVEDLVGLHPDVGQVAVVGVADARWGEAVCAVVVAAAEHEVEPDELIAWTEGRMAGFKRPRHVVVVDELPMNASGKVDKGAVRRAAHDALAR